MVLETTGVGSLDRLNDGGTIVHWKVHATFGLSRLGEFEAVVFGEDFGEVVPAGGGLEIEDLEVEGDELGIEHL